MSSVCWTGRTATKLHDRRHASANFCSDSGMNAMADATLNRWVTSERIRYLGAFASMWNSFNDLYRRDSRFAGSDRNILSSIQSLPPSDPFCLAFDAACAADDQRVERSVRHIQDAATKGFVAHEAHTRFSALVSEVTANPTLGPLIWTSGHPRPAAGRATRQLPCLHIPSTVYVAWYRALRESEASSEGMVESSISVQDVLGHYGIASDASAFFVASKKPTQSQTIARILGNRLAADQHFSALLSWENVPQHDWVPPTRFAIALELLYLVRNNVMHGALDPTDMQNDPVGKTAYEVLFSWLLEISK